MFLFEHLKDFNIYSFNLPGHGQLSKEQSFDLAQIDMHNYCELAIKFILDFDLSDIVLVGHSMGGGIATAICEDERIKKRVIKLILETPVTFFSEEEFQNTARLLMPKDLMEVEKLSYELFYDPIGFFNGERFFKKFVEDEFEKGQKIKHLHKLLHYFAVKGFLTRISQSAATNKRPTLALLGRYDIITPTETSFWFFNKHNQDKNYAVKIIDKSKHLPMLEKKEICFQLIDEFLTQ